MIWGFWLTFTFLGFLADAKTQEDALSLRSDAAKYDMPFFTAFLNDFDTDIGKYTSFMMENHITLPQAIADYYYHLATITSDINLESDIVQTFPFTVFQTFVTIFPWYSSLLKEANLTTLYLPNDFVTTNTASLSTSITPENISTGTSLATRTSIPNSVESTTQSGSAGNNDNTNPYSSSGKTSSYRVSDTTSLKTKTTFTTVAGSSHSESISKSVKHTTTSVKSQNDSHSKLSYNMNPLLWTLILFILPAYM